MRSAIIGKFQEGLTDRQCGVFLSLALTFRITRGLIQGIAMFHGLQAPLRDYGDVTTGTCDKSPSKCVS